jgi:hypothetical protein
MKITKFESTYLDKTCPFCNSEWKITYKSTVEYCNKCNLSYIRVIKNERKTGDGTNFNNN